MSTENLFEQAVRLKVRFEYKGSLAVEDLWDLSLDDLNSLYMKLKRESKNSEDGLLTTRKTKAEKELELKLEIVKTVFEAKQLEAEEAKLKADNKRKKEYLKGVLERKQNAAMEELSAEEIQKMLDEL